MGWNLRINGGLVVGKVSGLPKTRIFFDDYGLLNTEGRVAQEEIEARIPITGTGTPEAIIEAEAGATYYDLSAGTGAIIYIKTAQAVNGDRTKGWILA